MEENETGTVLVDCGVLLHRALGRHRPDDQWPRGRYCILTRSHEDAKAKEFPPPDLLRAFASSREPIPTGFSRTSASAVGAASPGPSMASSPPPPCLREKPKIEQAVGGNRR